MDNINNSESKVSLIKYDYNIISLICISIAIIVRIFTPGWLWFLIVGIGPVHAILFVLSNYKISQFANKSFLANFLFWLSCITFTMIYVLLPDFSDTSSYAICGLVQDSKTIDILYIIVKYCIFINLILIFMGLFIKKIINSDKLEGNNDNLIKKRYTIIKKISIVILASCIISLVLCIIFGTMKGIIFYLVSTLLMFITVVFLKKSKIYWTISGLIASTLLLFSPSILYKVEATIFIIVCIKTIYENYSIK